MNGSSCQGRGRWVWSAFSRAAVVWTVWLVSLGVSSVSAAPPAGRPWVRHTVDDTSRGADGVRLGDINGDGLPDVVTGWEEGGVIRVYVNPGPARAAQPWPRVTVGRVGSPEDAVFVDLDRDGLLDVVSSCEGSVQTVFVHWSPRSRARLLDDSAWTTQPIPATENRRRWMFCLPLEIDGRNGVDLVVGSKQRNAAVGWLQSPTDPRDLARWQWHPLFSAGWVMSLLAVDVDHDGDLDVVTSDRKGPGRGCYWLENPGAGVSAFSRWRAHPIGGLGREVMFLTACDLDADAATDFVVAVRGGDLLYFRRRRRNPPAWQTYPISMPDGVGTGKAVAAGDVDLDGRVDLVVSCEHAEQKVGVFWLSPRRSVFDPNWAAFNVSGSDEGVKYDLVQLLDLDGDGDLDVLTCEERDNLGVVWYENPTR